MTKNTSIEELEGMSGSLFKKDPTPFLPLPDNDISKNIYVNLFKEYPSFLTCDVGFDDKKIIFDKYFNHLKDNINDTLIRVIYDVEDDSNLKSTDKINKKIDYEKADNFIHFILIFQNKLVVKVYNDGLTYFIFNEEYHNIDTFYELIYNIRTTDEFYTDIEKSNMIHFIVQNNRGLDLEDHVSQNTNEINIDKNYNDDFKDIDERIKNYIEDNKNGLILLHGEPGTGKTYYLRHLTKYSESKKFVFLPSTLSNALSDPGFVSFAIKELQNSVLIIEDAENVIQKRGTTFGGESQQSVANLLNLSDGLMSDVLNLQIICTFNANISEIDPALTRKGRLLLQYEFTELEVDKANKLLESLGKSYKVSEKTTLADIYNIEDDNGKENKQTNTIGFKNSNS